MNIKIEIECMNCGEDLETWADWSDDGCTLKIGSCDGCMDREYESGRLRGRVEGREDNAE